MNDVEALVEAHPDDVTAIAGQLRQLMARPGDTSFLVVSIDDVYVQFLAVLGSARVAVEAVSNANLPEGRRLDADGIAALLALGFAEPEEEGFNYAMDCAASGDPDFARLAVTTVAAIYGVYRCPENKPLAFELNLE